MLEKPQENSVQTASVNHTSAQGNKNEMLDHTAKKRNISEALSDSEGDTLTKKGRGIQRRGRQRSASPVTPPKGPHKWTNERPGLIGKKKRRTKAEIAAEKAAKEAAKAAKVAEAKELAEAKAEATARLAMMEVDQEDAEAERHQRVIHRQPSVLDVTANNGGEELEYEEFDLGSSKSGDTDDMDVDSDYNPHEAAALVGQTKVSRKRPLLERLKLTYIGAEAQAGASCWSR
jgi:hypothetical protein